MKTKRIVIKVGTSTLTHESGKLNLERIEQLVRVISNIKNMGHEVILVSSGSYWRRSRESRFEREA